MQVAGWPCTICTVINEDEDAYSCVVCGQDDPTRAAAHYEEQRRQKVERERAQRERQRKEAEAKARAEAAKKIEDEKRAARAEEQRKKRPRDIDTCVQMYRTVCQVVRENKQNHSEEQRDFISRALTHLYSMMLDDRLHPPERKSAEPTGLMEECNVCYAPLAGPDQMSDDAEVAQVLTGCDHASTCCGCFNRMIEVKLKEKDVLPWLVCPVPDCKYPIAPQDYATGTLTTRQLYELVHIHIGKFLAREARWIPCKNATARRNPCSYGFFIPPLEEGKVFRQTLTCECCRKKQKVEKLDMLDAEMKKMIADGIMRKCPRCQHPTFKERGVCNVLQCGACDIWWNWKTRDTAASSRDLKERARRAGTLWEPGELAYQQKLERENPEEFRKLLERNGVKYDPNYVRGRG
jgi:flagellar biosynthesis GTPase FlhF